ncbi:allophanate hydrolase subunit 1 [Curtobacterium sp. VKM Ac-2865]|uniref:5-oxoprolinase subunit B family protein n=1 Tax=Curtobacterium sp. VKM Ac-2865 TaxID=2783817 RepID=UPI00188BCE1D|nr:allophanate hydrolase subunit 1 [Curtobacterium sp. VKM Ac-2865]MBF4583248.1 allophanate hydrolase subunit 1 [Curtobacterium sp. VKM Ac-2865]
MTLDLRPAGNSALLATFATLHDTVAFRAGLADRPPGVTEVVSGARTLLFRYDRTHTDATRLRADLARVTPTPTAAAAATAATADTATDADATTDTAPVVIPVTYDGDDLTAVADLTGRTPADLVAWHTGQVWTSAFCGFAPGFSYLTGTAPSLDLPRRNTSRTVVPSGAVALAGEFSAVYPRTSPGGWQLIGRTDVPMWSLDRDPPALAPAGTRIRFVDTSGT